MSIDFDKYDHCLDRNQRMNLTIITVRSMPQNKSYYKKDLDNQSFSYQFPLTLSNVNHCVNSIENIKSNMTH